MFTTKSYQEFIKNRTQLSLDLKQLIPQAQNTSVGATLRKTLRCFDTFFSETIPIFFIRLSANILNVLHSKDAVKFKLKCTSHECMAVRINFLKNQDNVKTVNVVTQIFGRFVGYVCLEISRCYSESILMKVSDIVMHVKKII